MNLPDPGDPEFLKKMQEELANASKHEIIRTFAKNPFYAFVNLKRIIDTRTPRSLVR